MSTLARILFATSLCVGLRHAAFAEDADAFDKQGLAYKPDQAIEALEHAVSANPKRYIAWASLGNLYKTAKKDIRGVARGDRRHDRGIDDAQSRDAAHPEPGIHHGDLVVGAAHPAGADGGSSFVPMLPAAATSSSSDWKAGPERNSSGAYFFMVSVPVMGGAPTGVSFLKRSDRGSWFLVRSSEKTTCPERTGPSAYAKPTTVGWAGRRAACGCTT